MATETHTLEISSKPDTDIINITGNVAAVLKKSKIASGLVCVFVPGSTASVSTTEFEPNLNKDLEDAVERLVPSSLKYRHHETWGDDNGKSHVRATLFKPGLVVPFNNKQLLLGTWQQIVILDFDVPQRKRKAIIQIVG
jgi:secondary thiamine-phosphate synthase enzyme